MKIVKLKILNKFISHNNCEKQRPNCQINSELLNKMKVVIFYYFCNWIVRYKLRITRGKKLDKESKLHCLFIYLFIYLFIVFYNLFVCLFGMESKCKCVDVNYFWVYIYRLYLATLLFQTCEMETHTCEEKSKYRKVESLRYIFQFYSLETSFILFIYYFKEAQKVVSFLSVEAGSAACYSNSMQMLL